MEKKKKKNVASELDSDWIDGFLFLANQLALDLLNTRPLIDGEPVELLPDFDALLRWFRAAGIINSRELTALKKKWTHPIEDRRALASILSLREMLRKEVISWESGTFVHPATIDELNRLLCDHPVRRRLIGRTGSVCLEEAPAYDSPEDLIAPLAEAAARLFAEADRSRVRRCDRCILHFLDTSKKGTRRWCSMRLCGNRAKVADYAKRQKDGGR